MPAKGAPAVSTSSTRTSRSPLRPARPLYQAEDLDSASSSPRSPPRPNSLLLDHAEQLELLDQTSRGSAASVWWPISMAGARRVRRRRRALLARRSPLRSRSPAGFWSSSTSATATRCRPRRGLISPRPRTPRSARPRPPIHRGRCSPACSWSSSTSATAALMQAASRPELAADLELRAIRITAPRIAAAVVRAARTSARVSTSAISRAVYLVTHSITQAAATTAKTVTAAIACQPCAATSTASSAPWALR